MFPELFKKVLISKNPIIEKQQITQPYFAHWHIVLHVYITWNSLISFVLKMLLLITVIHIHCSEVFIQYLLEKEVNYRNYKRNKYFIFLAYLAQNYFINVGWDGTSTVVIMHCAFWAYISLFLTMLIIVKLPAWLCLPQWQKEAHS